MASAKAAEPTDTPTDAETPGESSSPTSSPTTIPSPAPSPSTSPSPSPSTATPSATPTPSASITPTPTPSLPPAVQQIVESFQRWFAQPSVQATFATRLAAAVDLGSLEQQVATALASYFQTTMQTMLNSMMSSLQAQLSVAMQTTMSQLTSQMSTAMSMDSADFAKVFQFTMDPAQLSSVLMSMMNADADSLDSNLQKLGYGTLDTPSSIDIYPKDFAAKQHVLDILNTYNDDMKATGQEDKVITYTDIVGTLMASVTDIISKVSSVLVAFVSISLVVSSIMIGVITYISVLERRKEIGILRALGASKRDVGNVFNAETLIVGFVAGLLGVLITIGLTLIANPIVYSLFQIHDIARLP
jgi:ABC-type antimicrobial peptide transport system permease subunit